jgi:hypothetical protein
MTNFEKIKDMSVNEFADWMSLHANCVFCPAISSSGDCEEICFMQWMNWLTEELAS